MALTITSPQDGQKKLQARLKKMEREISFLCANYRKELAKPIFNGSSIQENVFESLFVGILTWVLLVGLLIPEIIIVSDLQDYSVAITMASITIATELLALYSVDKIKRDNRFSGLEANIPMWLNFLKLFPIILNIGIAYSRIKASMTDENDLLSSLLNGGGYLLTFLFVYGFLLYMAHQGQFLENLITPFELIKEKRAIREQQSNSRNEEVLVQIRQDVRDTTDTWLNGINRYGTIYNPIGEDGQPNQNFVKIYGQRQQQNFVYEPYQHSLTNEDIRTINTIYEDGVIAQRGGTQQLGGGGDIQIDDSKSPEPPMGLGGGIPPTNQDFNDKKGIIV